MYRIILAALLICSLHSQTVEVVDEPQTPPPLPSEDQSNSYLLNPNRQALSLELIDNVFSRQDFDCKFKIKYLECYLGKLKGFILRSAAVNKGKKPEGPRKQKEVKEGKEKGDKLALQLSIVQVEVKDLEDLEKKLNGIINDDIELEERPKALQLANIYLIPKAQQQSKQKFKIFQKETNDNVGEIRKLKKRQQPRREKLKKLKERKEEKKMKKQPKDEELQKQMEMEEMQINVIEEEIKGMRKKFGQIRSKHDGVLKQFRGIGKKQKEERKKRENNLRNQIKIIAIQVVNDFFSPGVVERSSAVFTTAEEREFSCIGISPISIEENKNQKVVTTLSSTDFQAFIQATYGVNTIPNFDHTAKEEIKLIRHTVLERRVSEEFSARTKCCDEDLQIFSGKIVSIKQAAYTILPDGKEQQVTVDFSVCSRGYKTSQEVGDRIILKTAMHAELTYILDALIYESDPPA